MTPTEQDNKLREKLYSVFEIDCDYYSPTVQNGCGYDGFYCKLHTAMLDSAMQLITQYGDTREREGRMQELAKIKEDGGGCKRVLPFTYFVRRLAELKEEV